jgi:hypothetical protein
MNILSRTLPGANFMTASFIRASWRVSLAVLFLTWGMHAMAAPNDKPVTSASNVVVTLDVYSGRPNPTWPLAEGMTVEFLRRLHALDGSKAAPREFEDLGYRAVSVELQDETKGTVVVKASRGIVTLNRAGQQFHYVDAGRQFELWLVNTGGAHLTPDILRYVTGEIAKRQ